VSAHKFSGRRRRKIAAAGARRSNSSERQLRTLHRHRLRTASVKLGHARVYRSATTSRCRGRDLAALDELLSFLVRGRCSKMFGLYDMFAGGTVAGDDLRAGIRPTSTRLDILPAADVVWPYPRSCAGRRARAVAKITQYTRYGTIVAERGPALGIASFWSADQDRRRLPLRIQPGSRSG